MAWHSIVLLRPRSKVSGWKSVHVGKKRSLVHIPSHSFPPFCTHHTVAIAPLLCLIVVTLFWMLCKNVCAKVYCMHLSSAALVTSFFSIDNRLPFSSSSRHSKG